VKTSTLKSRDGAALDKVTIDAFRRGFCGQVLLPGDTGHTVYGSLRYRNS
jgi:hypothetical protein